MLKYVTLYYWDHQAEIMETCQVLYLVDGENQIWYQSEDKKLGFKYTPSTPEQWREVGWYEKPQDAIDADIAATQKRISDDVERLVRLGKWQEHCKSKPG